MQIQPQKVLISTVFVAHEIKSSKGQACLASLLLAHLLDVQVSADDAEHVQMLSLVLMNTLDLNIVQGVGGHVSPCDFLRCTSTLVNVLLCCCHNKKACSQKTAASSHNRCVEFQHRASNCFVNASEASCHSQLSKSGHQQTIGFRSLVQPYRLAAKNRCTLMLSHMCSSDEVQLGLHTKYITPTMELAPN